MCLVGRYGDQPTPLGELGKVSARYNLTMPTQLAPTPPAEQYNYPLKTNVQMRRRVQAVQRQYGISFNAAIHILLREALDARGVEEE